MQDFQPLVYLMYETEYLNVLKNLYEWSVVGPDYVDDPRYTISKKFSEVLKRLQKAYYLSWY